MFRQRGHIICGAREKTAEAAGGPLARGSETRFCASSRHAQADGRSAVWERAALDGNVYGCG
jgi:hypothetical protein